MIIRSQDGVDALVWAVTTPLRFTMALLSLLLLYSNIPFGITAFSYSHTRTLYPYRHSVVLSRPSSIFHPLPSIWSRQYCKASSSPLLWQAGRDNGGDATPQGIGSPKLSVNSGADAADTQVKVTAKASELYDSMGLSQDERTVVDVHRTCSPSVVYVTSVLTSPTSANTTPENPSRAQSQYPRIPQGMSLGSGSGFVIDSEGYIVTNYHVIQRAYEANQAMMQYQQFWEGVGNNATRIIGGSFPFLERIVNQTLENGIYGGSRSKLPPAQAFVRFGTNGNIDGSDEWSGASAATYQPCQIVDVVKELDIAVLKIQTESTSTPLPSIKPLPFGSSSNLLVGQTLLAIGNPFGLDRTITSGLVSALGRTVTGVQGNPIRNCIQTDGKKLIFYDYIIFLCYL